MKPTNPSEGRSLKPTNDELIELFKQNYPDNRPTMDIHKWVTFHKSAERLQGRLDVLEEVKMKMDKGSYNIDIDLLTTCDKEIKKIRLALGMTESDKSDSKAVLG